MANRKFLVPESGPDGSPGAPTYTFLNGLTTGLYYAGSNGLGLSTNGGARLTIDTNGQVSIAAPVSGSALSVSGSVLATGTSVLGAFRTFNASAPLNQKNWTLSTDSSGNLQFAQVADSLGSSSNYLFLSNTQLLANNINIATTSSNQFLGGRTAGANAGLPDYSFVNDPDTGIYSSAANTLNLSAGGTSRLQINGTEVLAGGVPLTTVTQSGAPVSTPSDGALAVDTTNNRLYFRSGGVWRGTAGAGSATYTIRTGGRLVFGAAGAGFTFSASGGNTFVQDDGSVATSPLLRTLKVTDTDVALVAQVLYTLIDDLQALGIVN